MKTLLGVGFIILGFISLTRYPNLGKDIAESIGVLIGVGLFTFLPGILLIKSDSKIKSNSDEK
jgi:hypothetical protein